MKISSPSFKVGGLIPARFTRDGENIAPVLDLWDIPTKAQSLVLIMEDPDARGGLWTHWLVWNIPPNTYKITSRSLPPGAGQGLNAGGGIGYNGPYTQIGRHRYFFRLLALDTRLNLSEGSQREDLMKALLGHVITESELVGEYGRGEKSRGRSIYLRHRLLKSVNNV
jgi:hypothetical protein